jgi:hypothetical protein
MRFESKRDPKAMRCESKERSKEKEKNEKKRVL